MQRTLLPLSGLYALVLFLRNLAFDAGLLKITRVTVPVIAVGNLTAGGTGKTPLVEWLVGRLLDRGRNVGVVSRGYGRRSTGAVVVSDGTRVLADSRTGGDEPVQIAQRFPRARVVVGERRVEAAAIAIDRLKADVLVLDDAFQHRYLQRDLNILVLDGGVDIRREPLIPAGMRREPLQGLKRADVVALSGVTGSGEVQERQRQLGRWCSAPFAGYRYGFRGFRRAHGTQRLEVEAMAGRKVFAFSAIGRHDRFLSSLVAHGLRVAGEIGFRDHHWFTPEDVEKILGRFQESHAEVLVTTEKDVVRMAGEEEYVENFLRPFPVWVAEIDLQVVDGEATLLALVEGCLKRGG